MPMRSQCPLKNTVSMAAAHASRRHLKATAAMLSRCLREPLRSCPGSDQPSLAARLENSHEGTEARGSKE